jgi:hypothetical protein
VFRDGGRTKIRDYATDGKVLYAFEPHAIKKIVISDLDISKTIEVNEQRGVSFELP